MGQPASHANLTSRIEPQLIARVRSGDLQALGELYDSCGPRLLSLAYRLTGSLADAEDVVHDVFLGLPEALRSYEERDRPRAWLNKITARVVLSRMRTRNRKRETDLEAALGVVQPQPSPLSATALHDALESIPEPLRHVFLLKEAEGYTHAEIAGLLDITIAASQVRLHRAIRLLRQRLTTNS
ncbi:MAG TPA: RNA polymerase sigma factor [Gemmatimonadaceae bacterium]|nr:RNA polymerase sigma factor [Gemmatimonadaceae bacterium]